MKKIIITVMTIITMVTGMICPATQIKAEATRMNERGFLIPTISDAVIWAKNVDNISTTSEKYYTVISVEDTGLELYILDGTIAFTHPMYVNGGTIAGYIEVTDIERWMENYYEVSE